ncbi:MAG: bacteriocin [Streptococcaceae bacterium]|jgi:bacteriocin-like protein|nr:bacteriocin [Streptococcaceae bacterium]
MMTNEKLMALDFVELNDEELQVITGGLMVPVPYYSNVYKYIFDSVKYFF